MELNKPFTGTGVALITPFLEDGTIDFKGLSSLIEFNIAGRIDYLVVLGTTAESVTLSKAEQNQIMRFVVEVNRGRLPLVVGIGGNNTLALVEELQTGDFSGYDAILSVTPYYNKPSQEGIYRHFGMLAENSLLPIIIYNVPSRTGVNMLPETVNRLARSYSNIIGLKEAIGDMAQISTLLELVPDSFSIISGDDATAIDTVLEGGAGVISVLGQAIPDLFSAAMRSARAGDRSVSTALNTDMLKITEMIFREGNPAGIKAMLELLAICSRRVRLPLVEASEGLVAAIAEELHRLTAPTAQGALNLG